MGMGCQDVIDPYSYLDRLRMPKLIIVASNDEFFMMDDRWGGGVRVEGGDWPDVMKWNPYNPSC